MQIAGACGRASATAGLPPAVPQESQQVMAGLAPLQEDIVRTCFSLHAALCETAFNADRSQALTRCCHLMSAVLTDGVSLPVTGSGHHFVTAKSKLTTQTSQNVMQLILKVFHRQREKK